MAINKMHGLLALLALVVALVSVVPAGSLFAQEQGSVPVDALRDATEAEFWQAIRRGERGAASLPDPRASLLIQSEGENWRAIRNGPLSLYGSWLLIGTIAILALYFALKGRLQIQGGRSGHTVTRFGFFERFTHWLTAVTFIVLAITGLNVLYGRYVLKPLIGPDAFAAVTSWGKYLHNYLAFGFMLGVLLMIIIWARYNLPNRQDLIWLAKGGGLFVRTHVPASKFNAGQKLLFWLVVLGGISVSFSGIMLLFPFRIEVFGGTFEVINFVLRTDLPTDLAPLQEMQLAQIWHAILGLILSAVIIAHIFLGTIGMEGAFDAMGSGDVDENWAKEHHSIWADELRREGALDTGDD